MPEAILCTACGLQHERRRDATCPHCGANVAAAAAAGAAAVAPGGFGSATHSTSPKESAEEGVELPVAVRIAGGVLVLNACALVAEMVTASSVAPSGGAPPVVPAAIDLVIGSTLAFGNAKYHRFALVRVVLGLVIFGGIQFAMGELLQAAFQIAFSGSLLLLLIGKAGAPRIAIAMTLIVPYFMLEALGLFVPKLVNSLALSASGTPISQVEGVATRYRITAPGNQWLLRDDAAAKKDNALADRWIVRPGDDAHVIVIVEHLGEASGLTLEDLERAVQENLKSGGRQVAFHESEALHGKVAGRQFRYSMRDKSFAVEGRYAVFLDGEHAFQVMGFAPKGHSRTIAVELQQIVESFEIAP